MNQKSQNIKLLKKIHTLKAFFYPFIYILIVTGFAKRNKTLIDKFLKFIKLPKSINNFLQRFQYEETYNNAFKNQNSGKLAVFPALMGINSNFNLLNLLLSSKLVQHGYEPILFYCKSDLPICNKERIGKTRKSDPFLCHECYTGYSRLSEKTGIKTESFSVYIDEEVKIELKHEITKIENLKKIDELSSYRFQNIQIGLISKKSVMRYFFTGELKEDEKTISIFKTFLKACVKTYMVFDSFIKKNKTIGVMIIQNGTLAVESTIIEVCLKHKIDFITYERWVGDNSLLLKKNGKVMDLRWDDEWEVFSQNPLMESQKKKVADYLLGLQSGKEMYARLNETHQNEKIQHLKKYVCLFTNLNFDTAVLEKHIAFNSMIHWIIEVINFWQDNNVETGLVIRIHPGEVKLRTPSKEFAAELLKPHIHSSNIILLDSTDTVNSYNLIEKMDFGLVYTSTIGLEIAYRGKPILVAGDAFYRNKPFCISPENQTTYFETLNKIINKKLNENLQKETIEKYIYFIYFHKTKRLNGMKLYTPNSELNSDVNNWKKLLNVNELFLNDFMHVLKGNSN